MFERTQPEVSDVAVPCELSLDMNGAQLRDLLEAERRRGTIVKHHPLGFLRLPLSPRDASERYYLHVWPELELARQDPSSEVHNHNFDLRSRILFGGLTNRQYSARDNEKGAFSLLKMEYEGERTTRVATSRRVTCKLESESSYVAGDIYDIAKGTFHETVIDQKPTVTLMRKANVERHLSPLNVARSDSSQSEFSYRSTLPDLAWDIVMAVLSRCK
jgi:hypothetical protein